MLNKFSKVLEGVKEVLDKKEKRPPYKKGDLLILKQRKTKGYGVRPVVEIVSYNNKEESKSPVYHVIIYTDETTNTDSWLSKNQYHLGTYRSSEKDIIQSDVLEEDFTRVKVDNEDKAVAHYKSIPSINAQNTFHTLEETLLGIDCHGNRIIF